MRARDKIMLIGISIGTALASAGIVGYFGFGRQVIWVGKDARPAARYVRYVPGRHGIWPGGRGGRAGVPTDFCVAADKGMLGTVRVVATDGEMETTSGSGAVISPDGFIVTNNHVIEGANVITVTLPNRHAVQAKLVGADGDADLAVLKIDEKGMPFLLFGNSNDLKVGQWVLAVGYPFGLMTTVTAGIVSARGKDPGVVKGTPDPLASYIQTDAAVNVGNSGGPLINPSGEIIGINTGLASPNGVYTGYSFAIPVSVVRKTVDAIIARGRVRKE